MRWSDVPEPPKSLPSRARKTRRHRKLLHGLAQEPFVVLDTETTSMEGHVIEVGVVDHEGNVLLDTLVKSFHQRVTPGAEAVHGISDDDLEDAPTWVSVGPKLKRVLSDQQVLIYNRDFDVPRLRKTLLDHTLLEKLIGGGETKDPCPWAGTSWCVMKAYAAAEGKWDDYHQSFTWVSLEEACSERGVEVTDTHRAADDADLTRRLVQSFNKPGEDPAFDPAA